MVDSAHSPDLAALLRDEAWIRRLATRLSLHSHDADDVVQDAMLAAVTTAPSAIERFPAWLNGVIRNVAGRRRRREGERAVRELVAARRSESTSPAEIARQFRLRHAVSEAVLALR